MLVVSILDLLPTAVAWTVDPKEKPLGLAVVVEPTPKSLLVLLVASPPGLLTAVASGFAK